MNIKLTNDTTLILERESYEKGGKYIYNILKNGLSQGAPIISKKPLWEEEESRDKKIKRLLYKFENDEIISYKPSEKHQIIIDAINSISTDERIEMETFIESTPVQKWTYIPNTKFNDVMDAFRKLVYVEVSDQQLVTCATFLTNKLPGDVVWLMLVAPPATTKSETIRSITPDGKVNDIAHPISLLTPNTFISGHEDADDLLPRIDGKIVTIKDFTTILSKNTDARNEIFAQLRELADGYMHKETGNGMSKGYNCHITIIGGVTNEIDKYSSMNAILGARFLYYRTSISDMERLYIAKKSSEIANDGNEEKLRIDISNRVLSIYQDFKPENLPEIPINILENIQHCAHIASILRTGVSRDFNRNVTIEPESESPGRIMKSFVKLSRCIAYLLEKDKVDLECVSMIYQLSIDSAEKRRITILKCLCNTWMSTKDISLKSGFPHTTCNEILEDLLLIGIIGKRMEFISSKKYENQWIINNESTTMYFINQIEREIRYENRHNSILFNDDIRKLKHIKL